MTQSTVSVNSQFSKYAIEIILLVGGVEVKTEVPLNDEDYETLEYVRQSGNSEQDFINANAEFWLRDNIETRCSLKRVS